MKKKIPKLQKGGFISNETAKELGFYRGHDNELTPEQLKKFTEEVEKALLKDLNKRWGISIGFKKKLTMKSED